MCGGFAREKLFLRVNERLFVCFFVFVFGNPTALALWLERRPFSVLQRMLSVLTDPDPFANFSEPVRPMPSREHTHAGTHTPRRSALQRGWDGLDYTLLLQTVPVGASLWHMMLESPAKHLCSLGQLTLYRIFEQLENVHMRLECSDGDALIRKSDSNCEGIIIGRRVLKDL
jgi:hypothetical protein